MERGLAVAQTQNYAALNASDDRILVGRAADGDMISFEILVRRYAPLMRAYAARILSSNDEVDDVVQEAFITAWQQLPSLQNGGAVKSWMMRIVSHKSIDRIRATRLHSELGDDDYAIPDSATPSHIVEARSQIEALAQALSALSEQQRECWILKEIAEYSYDEIAETLELPLSTVRGLLARARKNLIPRMEAWR